MNKKGLKLSSLCVREIKENRTTQPHVLPLYASSSFEFDSIDQGIAVFKGDEHAHVYSRFGNPTVDAVARKIASLEAYQTPAQQAEALLFSSGMSAILTLMLATLQSGDKVLTQANLYGGTTEQFLKILKPNGIIPIFTDLSDLDRLAQDLASDSSIKMIYAESPANPTLACVDLQQVSALAKRYDCLTAIDNTFMTPYLQQPFAYEIDFVIHSTTKFLNGHGNSTAGVLISTHVELMQKKIWQTMKLAGTNTSPWDAWMIHNGLKTLAIRMERHCHNAMIISEYLEQNPRVSKVNYPGLTSHKDHHLAKRQMKDFGGMLSFEVEGGFEAAIQVMRKFELCTLAPTLGDVDTLVLHPASSSHVNIDRETRLSQGINDGLIRMSVGIEDVDDIISDLEQALA